jgi:nicotinate-nucleotide adenylyltransferase
MDTTSRIGLLGGTFDPIHHGHLIAAAELRHALGLERVLLIPNAAPPHKPGVPVSSAEDRVAMLRLAIENVTWLAVDTIELERGGLSYTVDTLNSLNARLAPATLFFLMGEDSLRDLSTWKDPDAIVTLAHLGVATRPGVVVNLESVYRAVPRARGRVHLVQIPEIGIASRDIRQRVVDGRPITFQVPEAVERYIRQQRLYRST